MITFVDPSKVRKKRDPGRCYLRAGFAPAGTTKGGLIALQMIPENMPDPEIAKQSQLSIIDRIEAAGGGE
jgi:hypothetical protein